MAQTNDTLIKLALIDANTDKIVPGFENLANNAEINLDGLDLSQFNLVALIDADAAGTPVKSVKFESSLGDRVEELAPYALFGDSNGDFFGKTPKPGSFSVKVTAFSQDKAKGQAIASISRDYALVNAGQPSTPTPAPTPPTSPDPKPNPVPPTNPGGSGDLIRLALVNTGTNQIVPGFEDLSNKAQLDLNDVNIAKFSVIAVVDDDNPDASKVESIRFETSVGDRTESIEPYALFGDNQGNFPGINIKTGNVTIKATAYSGDKGSGSVLDVVDADYAVIDTTPPSSSGNPPPLPQPQPLQPQPPQPQPGELQNSLMGQFDQVVSHFDGNAGDADDIASLPIAAALTFAAGFQNKSTMFYNNNLGEPSVPDRVQAMSNSAAYAEQLGIQTFDYEANTNRATNALAQILNSGDDVLILEGGPLEATYRALDRVSSQNLSNITLVTHSGFNNNRKVASRPGVSSVRNLNDIQADFPQVDVIRIPTQNGPDGAGNLGFYSNQWNWLDSTSNGLLQDARDLMENAGSKKNDPSDAGMHFFALTGDETGNALDARAFFNEFLPGQTSLASTQLAASSDALTGTANNNGVADALTNVEGSAEADLVVSSGAIASTSEAAVDFGNLGSASLISTSAVSEMGESGLVESGLTAIAEASASELATV